MVSHTDYPKYGEYPFSYSDLQPNGELSVRLASVVCDETWFLRVFTFNAGERTFIFTTLSCFEIRHHEEFRVGYYLGFLNHLDESKSEVFIERCDSSTKNAYPGPGLLESKALDEKNGWLKDGKLSVVFGIHVEAFKETIWKFNFYDPIFQRGTRMDMIGFEKGEEILFHSHKQLLIHHSSTLAKKNSQFNRRVGLPDFIEPDSLEKCLQIVHGVQIRIDWIDYFKVLRIAHYYKLHNVIRYCEMEIIQITDRMPFVKGHISTGANHKLSRYLASVLRDMESPEAIKEAFCYVNIDIMTGEMMKQCVMKLFGFY